MLVLALCLSAILAGCGHEPDKPKPTKNVVLISVCSVRADHMSCYGYRRQTTPRLAEFARQCVVYDNAFTQWPKTTPAFCAIMSAKYAHNNGVLRATHGPRLADEHVTLAEVMADAGYQTAAFLSSPALAAHSNIAQGFQNVDEVFVGPRRAVLPTIRAIEWLRKRDPKKPFFIWAHYNNAHYPYRASGIPNPDMFVEDQFYDASRHVRALKDPRAHLKADVPRDHPCVMEILRPDIGAIHTWAVLDERPEELDFYIARYDAGIYSADASIGRLLDELRTLGLLDNTIVALVGDHGESLGDHNYYFEHGRFPYDATAHVPLMIRQPRGAGARHVSTQVAAFDLAPTLLEMTGLTPPEDWDARSLGRLDKDTPGDNLVFTEAGYQLDYMLAVHDSEWKLIDVPNALDRQMMRHQEYELYRWRDDPGETRELSAAHPDQVARLAAILDEWAAPWRAEVYANWTRNQTTIPTETSRQLESLGYVGSNSSEDEEGDDGGD
ncbi:MAG: sulfatase [Phycisphaerae bacterium]|nr:sulfatase [Phycisphaerae bacterium]